MSERNIERALRGLTPAADAEEACRELAAGLGDLAEARGELDVALATVGSPLGDLLIAVTPKGLLRVAYEHEDRDAVLEEIAEKVSPRIIESARATDGWHREFDEYFDQERQTFDLRVDRRLMKPLAKEVLAKVSTVPFGRVTTYGEVAERIGRPRAARAVGTAVGSNPIPIVVPCHRVVPAGGHGRVGGYSGGSPRKEFLLTFEGADLK